MATDAEHPFGLGSKCYERCLIIRDVGRQGIGKDKRGLVHESQVSFQVTYPIRARNHSASQTFRLSMETSLESVNNKSSGRRGHRRG